jgi:hypothetical protein
METSEKVTDCGTEVIHEVPVCAWIPFQRRNNVGEFFHRKGADCSSELGKLGSSEPVYELGDRYGGTHRTTPVGFPNTILAVNVKRA